MLARVGRDILLVPGTEHGQSAAGFYWHRTIRPYTGKRETETDSGAVPVLPYEIAVTVSWQSGGKAHDLSLRSLRLKASRSDAH